MKKIFGGLRKKDKEDDKTAGHQRTMSSGNVERTSMSGVTASTGVSAAAPPAATAEPKTSGKAMEMYFEPADPPKKGSVPDTSKGPLNRGSGPATAGSSVVSSTQAGTGSTSAAAPSTRISGVQQKPLSVQPTSATAGQQSGTPGATSSAAASMGNSSGTVSEIRSRFSNMQERAANRTSSSSIVGSSTAAGASTTAASGRFGAPPGGTAAGTQSSGGATSPQMERSTLRGTSTAAGAGTSGTAAATSAGGTANERTTLRGKNAAEVANAGSSARDSGSTTGGVQSGTLRPAAPASAPAPAGDKGTLRTTATGSTASGALGDKSTLRSTTSTAAGSGMGNSAGGSSGGAPMLKVVAPAAAIARPIHGNAFAVPDSPGGDFEESDSERTPLKSPGERDLAGARDTPISKQVKKRPLRRVQDNQPKRGTFYESDKFRAAEANGRDETDELTVFQISREVEESFDVVPGEVFRAFSDLRDVAREANTEISVPEFVVFGLAGHGKTSVVEALLGWPALHSDFESPAKRPVMVSMQNNPKFTEPRFTVMSDLSLGVKKRMVFTDYREVQKEIALRLGKSRELVKTPVHLLIEHSDAVNFNIIECPGLHPFNESHAAVSLVTEFARPVNRTLIVVEECGDWKNANRILLNSVLQLDPTFSRTIFVHSKLNSMLQGIHSSAELDLYFRGISRVHAPLASFWVTSLSSKCRAACTSASQYRLRLLQARMRDLQELEYLHYDRDADSRIGVTALRSFVLKSVVAKIRSSVPQIFYSLERSERLASELMSFGNRKVDGEVLDASLAKTYGLKYVGRFLSVIEDSVSGTLDVNPALFGERSVDESTVDWTRDDQRKVQANARLVGAQQFQRLLAELRAMLTAVDFEVVLPATDYPDPPLNKIQDDSNVVAAHFAHVALSKGMLPLFGPACDRAEHIMEHLYSVFEAGFSVGVSEENYRESPDQFVLANAPYFRSLMRDKFVEFLMQRRRALELSLRESLFSEDTLRWAVLSFPSQYAPPKQRDGRAAHTVALHTQNEVHSARGGMSARAPVDDKFKGLSQEAKAELERIQHEQVAKARRPRAVAKRMFAVHSKRIIANATLLFFRHMLDVQHDLGNHLRTAIVNLKPEEVAELFNVEQVRDVYERKRAEVERLLESLRDTKSTYEHSSRTFLSIVAPNATV
jgi:hypothetical protein